MMSANPNEPSVIVKLPNNSAFLDEITDSIKIYKFLNKNREGAGAFDSIRRAKEDERIEKKDRIRIFLEEALKNADIYVNGDKANITAKDPVSRINEALGKLVAVQYNKLTYMETAPELSDIAAIFNETKGQMSIVGTSDSVPNKLALDDVVAQIALNNQRRTKTSMKSLQDKFMVAPYGFDVKDVQWLVAMLFKLGRISLTINSQALSILSNSREELVRYITKRDYVEKLLIDIRERATDGQIRSIKEVLKDYFGYTITSDDDDVLQKSFRTYAGKKQKEYADILVEYRLNSKFPAKQTMEQAKKRIDDILEINDPAEFFKTVDRERDDLLDDAEDTAPVFAFFYGEQKAIFEKALKFMRIFENSKTYVRDQEITDIYRKITDIVNDRKPFGRIHELPELIQKFVEKYGHLLEAEAEAVKPALDGDYQIVRDVLDKKDFADEFRDKFAKRFDELRKKLETSNEIAAVKNIRLESDTLKLRCLDEIEEYEQAHRPEPPVTPPGGEGDGEDIPPVTPPPVQKKRKNLSISNVAGARTYSLESEADIDRFLNEMRKKLVAELEENTIITLS